MKERFKQNKLLFLTLAALAAVLLSAAAYLSTRDYSYGDNPIRGLNENRSQILVTGENYSLNHEQEEKFLEEEKKREERIEEEQKREKEERNEDDRGAAEEKPGEENKETGSIITGNGPGSAGGENGNGDGNGTGQIPAPDPGGDDDETVDPAKQPIIECSLYDGQTFEGARIHFTVSARDYRNTWLNSSHYNVTINGNKIYSSGTEGGVTSYKNEDYVVNGPNDVVVSVSDDLGNTAVKTYSVIVNTEGEMEKAGDIYLTVEARTVGLGTLVSGWVPIYEGDNMAAVVDRALKEEGFTPHTSDGGIWSGYYLEALERPGLTAGWSIPDPILQKLEEVGATVQPPPTESVLSAQDIYRTSGWMYWVNGYRQDGFSAVTPYDGDEVKIFFSLYSGAEYDGTWFNGDW